MISWVLEQAFAVLGWLLSRLLSTVAWVLTPVPLLVISATLVTLYLWYTRQYGFWRERGVRGPTATFPYGQADCCIPLVSSTIPIDTKLYYDYGGKNYCGYFEFRRPVLLVGDPELIKTITIKEFDSFSDLRKFEASDSSKHMLTSLSGETWKHTRSVMTPTFSASKLKGMYDITLANAENLSNYLAEEMGKKGDVEIRDASNRFTMDNIADCAFGVNCNSFEDQNAKFAKMANVFTNPDLLTMLNFAVTLALPSMAKYIPDPMKKVADFFNDITEKTIADRKASGVTRRDFLQLLMDSKDKDGNPALSRESMVQQCVLFFIAGGDTTSSLIMFAAHSIAKHPDIQRKVQDDIDDVLAKHDGQLTYEALLEMTYLDRVISETLRMYPPGTKLEREVTKEFRLPGANFTLPVGTLVQIPVYMIHHDPEYYPDPETFDPDRFLNEEKQKRHPCTYMPFGFGPRNCIAMRFALFEVKVALVAMLKNMTLEASEKTQPYPCPLEKSSLIPTPPNRKMHLRVIPRRKE